MRELESIVNFRNAVNHGVLERPDDVLNRDCDGARNFQSQYVTLTMLVQLVCSIRTAALQPDAISVSYQATSF